MPLEALMELGLVGALLLAAALGVPLVAAGRRTRTRKLPATAVLGAAVAWLVQACVDWTWTFPAVGIPVFLLLGIALAEDGRPALRLRSAAPVAALLVALALGGFALPYLSTRTAEGAAAKPWPVALQDYRHARDLDPLSTYPLIQEGIWAPTAAESIAAYAAAARLEPDSVPAHLCLVVRNLQAGNRVEARRQLPALLRLAPHDRSVLAAVAAVRGGPVPPFCRV